MVMGNASGREDGGPSATKSFEENSNGFFESTQDGLFLETRAFQHHNQNLVLPIPTPDQLIQTQTPATFKYKMHSNVVSNENLAPVKLSWNHGGKQVAVTGSWDNWDTRELLQGTGNNFYVVKTLPSGVYQYLFIVDGFLRCAPDLPLISDCSGNTFNILDLQENDTELPERLSEFHSPPSPPSSYDNKCLSEDDFSKPPPETPPQLQSTILNEPTSSSYDGHQALPKPQRTELNHLYIQNQNGGQFVALGSTRRFRHKYVTMVLYKPLRRTA
ncbi:hypothetical protein UlMin_044490 [Ulmus minor]